MKNTQTWIRKNRSTLVLFVFFVILLVSPDTKAWLMRQMISTGIFNSTIKESPVSTEKGSAAISFEVADEKGTVINTAQLKGKVIFINFWASWCPPCRAEFPSIQKFYEKYKTHPDMVFLTVNLDDNPELGKVYLTDNQFTIPFMTPVQNIPGEYYSGSLPTTVVLDKQGKIRMQHSGMADYSKESFYKQIDQLLKEQHH
ncbi:MAG: TlpA family protein disulfide reductase [Chryseobacterium sp.]|jgi:thiol-disulfide isomerase/thioredoxin|uniref:TlpA family protein disulfide reductase n=1 Tax=Chryseobacterium sp. TaxID=1871047 RepID=UPI002834DE74|nr:TlpA disulfide reductase family protein [Chryseobacterium sp.]MDR2235048.1 TlpA family protein disulfide reductase [Chryseobacterium sp.]